MGQRDVGRREPERREVEHRDVEHRDRERRGVGRGDVPQRDVGRRGMGRRDMVKATTGIAAGITLTGAAGAVMLSADGPGGQEQAVESAAVPAHTEKYRGRTIEVTEHEGVETVRIDGRELHLMKLGEGAYLSALCHYGTVASPLLAGRRAVEELRGAALLPLGHGGSHHGGPYHGGRGESA